MHIVDGLDCGVEDLQSVAENRAFFEGPLTASAVASLFIPKKEMFSIGTADGAVDAAQINVEGNQLDCSVLITHVYFHLVTPKESMLVEGAAWAGTGVLTTGTQTFIIPVVPDAWSASWTRSPQPRAVSWDCSPARRSPRRTSTSAAG